MDHRYKVLRRQRLFDKQNGLCHYCCTQMIIPQPYPSVGPWPEAMCTVEHLRNRFDPGRRDPKTFPLEERTVAACYKCNHERGIAAAKEKFPKKNKPRRVLNFVITPTNRLHGAFIKEDGDAA